MTMFTIFVPVFRGRKYPAVKNSSNLMFLYGIARIALYYKYTLMNDKDGSEENKEEG
jgi:hypothetical protein